MKIILTSLIIIINLNSSTVDELGEGAWKDV